MDCPLSLNHLLSIQLLTVCLLPFFEAYHQQLTNIKGLVIMDMIMHFPSQWVLFLAENESKDPMISRFALIVVVLLSFAITFEQIWDLNDFIWFLAIGSWNYYFPFSFVIVSL